MKISDIITYEAFIVVGLLMVIGTALKLFAGYDFSSDWFWLIGGIGLTVEGTLAYFKQAKFDKKFKVITQEEYEKLMLRKP